MAFKISIGGKQEHNEYDKDKNPKNVFYKECLLNLRRKELKGTTNFHCFL